MERELACPVIVESRGVLPTAPLRDLEIDVERFAPLVARWAAAHGLPLATAAALARRALDGEPEALLAFGTDAALVAASTGDPVAFLQVALDSAGPPAGDPTAPAAPAATVARTAAWRMPVRLLARSFAAVLLVFLVFVAYGTFVDNRWYKIVAVEGSSMEPTIRRGDAIVLSRPPSRVEEGMILTLDVEGRIVTHRVVQVHADGTFVTKGDANDARDDFRGLDVRIVGEYRARIPGLGHVLDP